MTDTAVRQTEATTAAYVEAQQEAAMAAAEQAALTLLQTYIQEGRAALASSTQAKAAVQAATDKILNACRATVSSAQQSGALTAEQADALNREIDRIADDLTPAVVQMFMDSLAEALESRAERISDAPEEDTQENRRTWASNVGRTLAARLVAENSVDLAKPVEKHLGTKLHKLWMSRGDAKVRGSHRKLHGSTAELDKPFWRELGTGRVLGFPGDPRAPIEQTINCRCWLWYVTEDQSAEAEATFKMPDSEFELIAASGHGHGSVWDLDPEILFANYDLTVGMAAATERKYDEEKHERSAIGQFAKKPKGSLATQNARAARDAQARARGYGSFADYIAQASRRPSKENGGKRRVGGAGGGSEADEAKKAAREALQEQQEAEREALQTQHEGEREAERASRERMRAERRTNVEKLRAQRRMEDARKRGERLTEDEALEQIRQEIQETERQAREKQREADQAAADVERSRDYIRQMRLRGENPEIIDAERQRLLGLESKHKKIVDDVNALFEKSRKLGTSDTVRRLRDRVRLSRRAEDDKIASSREQMDAAIRLKSQEQDDDQRQRERALRGRQEQQRDVQRAEHKARRKSLQGAGGPSTSCIICLLPVGDREITYNDGGTSPMHMTLGYMGDAAQYDDIDREMLSISTEEIADLIPPFTAKVAGQATLGEDSDTVTLIEAPEIAQARDYVMRDGALSYAVNNADEHPNWIPHITGLADADYQDEIAFDRLGLWVGEDRQEYPLNG